MVSARRDQHSRRCKRRTIGFKMAAVISAATKGASRDSIGRPTQITSPTASRASNSRTISRSHSHPRCRQVNNFPFKALAAFSAPTPDVPPRRRRGQET